MHYGNIKTFDISNGPGVRVSLYCSGCTHQCKNCFNPETWNFKYGNEFNNTAMDTILNAASTNQVSGLTLLGGEPLNPQNQECILDIIQKFKNKYPDKNIWMFTGYTYEHIQNWFNELPHTKDIINNIDVLVDGKFEEDLKDPELGFRGSSNQRIIDVPETLKTNNIVFHEKQFNKLNRKIWKQE